jgi:Domain of unknown function (DUF4062)
MKPRVFVSSTYYDLKHIRSNIERFIEQYGFEPVLFESGNVTFEHEKQLDESCYNEVKLCHMMILIIGGRYGSKATETETTDESTFAKNYEENYISITRKEFKTAQDLGIPTFIFIEKNVYAEYYTFTKNKDFFISLYKKPKEKRSFEFAHVDSVKIFEFIDEVKLKAIQTFEKFSDIEDYLRSQWAGFFFLYLSEQLKKLNDNKILDVVSEVKSVSERMNEMLNEVGKKLLKEPGEYEEVIKQQNLTILKYFSERLLTEIDLSLDNYSEEIAEEASLFVSNKILEYILRNKDIENANYRNYDDLLSKEFKKIRQDIKLKYQHFVKLNLLPVKGITPTNIKRFNKEIDPLVKKYSLEADFINLLANEIKDGILPF